MYGAVAGGDKEEQMFLKHLDDCEKEIKEREIARAAIEVERKTAEQQATQARFRQLKIQQILRDMGIDHAIATAEDEEKKKTLEMLRTDIQEENPNVLKMIELYENELSFDELGEQLLDKLPAPAFETLEDMKQMYYEVKNLNFKKLIGQGKITFARDPAKN